MCDSSVNYYWIIDWLFESAFLCKYQYFKHRQCVMPEYVKTGFVNTWRGNQWMHHFWFTSVSLCHLWFIYHSVNTESLNKYLSHEFYANDNTSTIKPWIINAWRLNQCKHHLWFTEIVNYHLINTELLKQSLKVHFCANGNTSSIDEWIWQCVKAESMKSLFRWNECVNSDSVILNE